MSERLKLSKKPERVVITEGDYAGAVLTLDTNVPVGRFVEIENLQRAGSTEMGALCEAIAGLVLDWNLDDDDGPLPVGVEGMKRLPMGLLLLIVDKWLEVQVLVPAPLGRPSSAGNGSAAAAIPMVALSGSP